MKQNLPPIQTWSTLQTKKQNNKKTSDKLIIIFGVKTFFHTQNPYNYARYTQHTNTH